MLPHSEFRTCADKNWETAGRKGNEYKQGIFKI